jgi:hypothetical protein
MAFVRWQLKKLVELNLIKVRNPWLSKWNVVKRYSGL